MELRAGWRWERAAFGEHTVGRRVKKPVLAAAGRDATWSRVS
ncbi:hypothetical protein OJ998_32765 [Solirubrobacter taibaiensis]|nr:hypothetical protein [Solirubrobacter taibaiensis]